jgi:hypothetical protein
MMAIALVFIVTSSIIAPSSIADLEKSRRAGGILRPAIRDVKRKAGSYLAAFQIARLSSLSVLY